MRWIQRRRMSPLRARRSRYEYASVFLCRRWAVTPGLMRVMGYLAYGIMRLRRVRSPGKTGIISSYSRAARLERLRRKWLLPWRVRTSLPDQVYSKRRAAALCVFNFGIKVGGRQVYHTSLQRQSHQQLHVAEPERARVGHL